MKKLFSILMVAFAVTAMVACGDNNEGTNNDGVGNGSGTSQNESLEYTLWRYKAGESGDNDYVYVILSFTTSSKATVSITKGNEGQVSYSGTYTYSNGNGTLSLQNTVTHEDPGTVTFSISGDNLTLHMLGETYTLTKQ